jgi:hypothetical protein
MFGQGPILFENQLNDCEMMIMMMMMIIIIIIIIYALPVSVHTTCTL